MKKVNRIIMVMILLVFSPGILKAQETPDFGNLIVDTSKGKQGIITFHNIGVKSPEGKDLGRFWAEFTWNLSTTSWVFNRRAGEEKKVSLLGVIQILIIQPGLRKLIGIPGITWGSW